MTRKVNFCFNIGNNSIKRFLSIEERTNGDLLIMPAKPDYFRKPYFPESNEDEIKQQKYSIHMSPNSDEFNVCMHNLELNNSVHGPQKIRTANYAKAIKSKSENLSPIFFCSPPDLSPEKYTLKVKKNEENLILDTLKLSCNTILYGIFICKNKGQKYLTFNIGNQNYKRLVFKNFTIIFVWTYWNFISTYIGSQLHIATLDSEKMKQYFNTDKPMQNNGLNGLKAKLFCHNLFNKLRDDLYQTYLKKSGKFVKYKILYEKPFSKKPYEKINITS